MKVFVTGATGFIGSAITKELIAAGHQVVGLARSDAAATSLAGAGAEVQRGELNDLDSLRAGVAASDGVVHAGFIHDFANFAASVETDRRAIETIGEALTGSGRPFVVASGTALIAPGRLATEDQVAPHNPNFPRVSEQTAFTLTPRNVRVSVMRLPPTVHGRGDHGFVPRLIDIAREKGVSAYIGDGLNRWAAVHRTDAAVLFRLALEKAPAGARLHAVADEGIATRDIAAIIGKHLDVPVVSKPAEDAGAHFGFLATFFGLDCPASAAVTKEQYGWQPLQPGLIADLDNPHYFATEMVSRFVLPSGVA